MNKKTLNLFAIALVIVLVVSISIYIYRDLTVPKTAVTDTSSIAVGEPSVTLDGDSAGADYKIEVLNNKANTTVSTSINVPDLSLPVVNRTQIDSRVFEGIYKNIKTISDSLKKNPQSELLWLDLATNRKILGDYSITIEILNYVSSLWPKDYVPQNNLADLYQNYTKNYPMAEKSWLKVIELNPSYTTAYENLYNLYTAQYLEKKDKALPVLLRGLETNPESINLIVFIARHYRSMQNTEMAKVYYDKAINLARVGDNEKLVISITSEASEVK